jgi:uncharacterized membrane protein
MKALAIGATLVVAVSAVDVHAGTVQLAELPGHTTEARVVVDAPPSEVYAICTDYARWPTVLSDVRSVHIASGGRENAKVHIQSRAFDRQVTVVFDNVPDRSISFHGAPPQPGKPSALAARGQYLLTPIDGGKRTQVVATLYVDVKGAAAIFVRDSKIRRARQEKLRADWEDVARHFERRDVARATASK